MIWCLLVLLGVSLEVSGHGMMLDPPNRASLWRTVPHSPVNYMDNQMFCGGFQVQFEVNNGSCGPCGDNFADPVPRSNENTGHFGRGIITKTYPTGSVVSTTVLLSANHLGSFTYSLCEIKDSKKPEEEACFHDLLLADGSKSHPVKALDYIVQNQVQLPAGFKCKHCVLRWHYKCGNSWGVCDDGTQGMGCGIQETFRSCADIAIN